MYKEIKENENFLNAYPFEALKINKWDELKEVQQNIENIKRNLKNLEAKEKELKRQMRGY